MREIISILAQGLKDDSKSKSSVDDIYKIHKYWARKPWYVVDEYIKKYSNEGDLIVDPFCGSGLTGCESICLKRNFLGIDLNPMSIRISNGTMMNDVDISSLQSDFNRIKYKCMDKILSLYSTDEICPKCGRKMLEKHLVCGGPNIGKSAIYCTCGKKTSKLIESNLERANITLEEKYWIPDTKMPDKFFKDRFSYKGVKKVSDFFTKRSLSALSFILDTIYKLESPNENLLLLAFTNTVLHCSKLKGENVRPMSVNNYWLPNDIIDENVWFRFTDRMENLLFSKLSLESRIKNIKIGSYKLINGSALECNNYEKADYFFTDPPYGETIQYSELSYIWNAWMNQVYDVKDEVIINPVQKKKAKEFNELLDISLENIYNSLKRGKFFTLCFANKEFKVWRQIIIKCKELGFQLENIESYDTYGTPFNKNWAKFSPKTDLYVTFKKISKSDKFKEINEDISLEDIIRDSISVLKEQNKTIDVYVLYDLTISSIIWLIFYNKKSFNLEDFDLKKFASVLEGITTI